MAGRAKLSAPKAQSTSWPWHVVTWTSLPSSVLTIVDRRLEAETYLSDGYRLRLSIEAQKTGWEYLKNLARVWQPSRLKGIQLSSEFGTPFLASMQVFDLRPTPRKWLSLDRTDSAKERFVTPGTILVTCSGSVGRATLACRPHEKVFISHDLLRVEPLDRRCWGWLYAYLLTPQARAIMTAVKYGHVIKHLETSHLDALPVPTVTVKQLDVFNERVRRVLDSRNRSYALIEEVERKFDDAVGPVKLNTNPEAGFDVKASSLFSRRRRLDAAHHSPAVAAILRRFAKLEKVQTLRDVTDRIWWMSRFKRVFGPQGVPYLSADELFSIHPPISKRVMAEQTENAEAFYGKAGWIVMSRSGQTYGLIGNVALLTRRDESSFFSDDLIRIIPKQREIRTGYLFAALGHPRLGRPLVIRHAYGTSIPHLEPADVAEFPVVRLDSKLEGEIADKMEEAVELRSGADQLEDEIARDAETITSRFCST
jgi:type I restriction enzyme S subunit